MNIARITQRTHRIPAFLPVVMVSLLLVSACSSPTRPTDSRQAFPITVSSENVALSVEVNDAGMPASRDEEFMIQRFVRDYLNRGRSELVLRVGAGDQTTAEQMSLIINKLGVPAADIVIRYDNTGQHLTALSFTGYAVNVPECGDFSSDETFNWSNSRSPNFGCSYRRNIGLMVTDPGDLIRSKPASSRISEPSVDAINNSIRPPAVSLP